MSPQAASGGRGQHALWSCLGPGRASSRGAGALHASVGPGRASSTRAVPRLSPRRGAPSCVSGSSLCGSSSTGTGGGQAVPRRGPSPAWTLLETATHCGRVSRARGCFNLGPRQPAGPLQRWPHVRGAGAAPRRLPHASPSAAPTLAAAAEEGPGRPPGSLGAAPAACCLRALDCPACCVAPGSPWPARAPGPR